MCRRLLLTPLAPAEVESVSLCVKERVLQIADRKVPFLLCPGDTVMVPAGMLHRVHSRGGAVLIEAYGACATCELRCGDRDIVRYDPGGVADSISGITEELFERSREFKRLRANCSK